MEKLTRKTFIHTTSLAVAGSFIKGVTPSSSDTPKIKAIAFDAFAIFDPRPIFTEIDELFPDDAKQLVQVWQYKQFSYQWLRLLGNRYKPFWDVTKDALDATFTQFGLNDKEKEKDSIMAKYDAINVWPDVIPAPQEMKKESIKVCFLSNMKSKMLHRGIENAGLKEYFDFVISTDEKQTYKPSPTAYQMAVETLKLLKEEILYVPFAGWDVAGGKWFGYPTFWLNRLNASLEKLDAEPDGQGSNLMSLLKFMETYNRSKQ
jgi:2-haloacid dehalogenase